MDSLSERLVNVVVAEMANRNGMNLEELIKHEETRKDFLQRLQIRFQAQIVAEKHTRKNNLQWDES